MVGFQSSRFTADADVQIGTSVQLIQVFSYVNKTHIALDIFFVFEIHLMLAFKIDWSHRYVTHLVLMCLALSFFGHRVMRSLRV